MRVAIITPTADVRHASLYLAAARAHGNVQLIVPEGPSVEGWPEDVTPLVLTSKGRGQTLQWMKGLSRAVEEFDPHVIHVHNEPWAVTCQRLVRSRRPVVLHGAESVLEDAPLPYRIRRIGMSGALGRAAGYINWGQTGLRAAERAGLPADTPRAAIPGSPPDPRSFPKVPTRPLEDRLQVVFVGRLTPVKGVDTLLKALAEGGRLTRTKLSIVGSGPEEARLRRLALDLGVDVKFLGHLDAAGVQRVIAQGHVLVVPSVDTRRTIEQWGRVVVEAMMSGRAVLVSDSGELPHIAGNPNWVFEQRSVQSLGTSLDALLTQPGLLQDRSEMAYVRSRAFHPDVLAQELLAFWADVLGHWRGQE